MVKKEVGKDLPIYIADLHGLRVWVSMLNKYETTEDEKEIPIQTHNKVLTNEWGIPPLIQQILLEIIGKNSEVIRAGSKLNYMRTEKITIKVAQWDMGAGRKWKTLPPFLENKRCFINTKNDDEKCFAYSLAAYLLQREALLLNLKFELMFSRSR